MMRPGEEFNARAQPIHLSRLSIALGASFLLVIAVAYYLNHNTVQDKDWLHFQSLTHRSQRDIETRMETYIALLQAGSALFSATEAVSQDAFRAFVDRIHLRQQYPGIQGIGFSRRIRPEEKAALVAARQQQEGDDAFRVWPEYERPEYHAILYLEPLDRRNQAALGFDMFTEPVRRAAMERARDTGLPAASARVTLKQEIDARKQAGFLIYVPVYHGGKVPATLAERQSRLLGFVYSPFRADDLLEGIVDRKTSQEIALRIFAGTALTSEHLLHRSVPDAAKTSAAPRFTTVTAIDIAGQPWSIAFATLPSFAASSERTPTLLLLSAIGLIFSLMVFWVMRSQVVPDPAPDTVGRSGSVAARFRAMSVASGWTTLGVGAVVCIGWLCDMPLLKSIVPQFPTMKANTAVGFMLTGVALVRLQARRVPCRFGQACATLVMLLGVLTLGQYALGWDLGIDHIFFKEEGSTLTTSTPGRMAVLTAFNFLCFGVALLVREVRALQGPQPAEYLALTGLLLSLLGLMKYLYSTDTFATFAPDFSSIALHTVVTFLMVGSGILLARPDHGMMAILSSATDGGRMGRRLLPATVVLFVMLSWLEQRGLQAGLYSEQFGLALLTVSLAVLFVLLILLSASSLYRVALRRHQAEVALRESDERFRAIVAATPMPLGISRLSDGLLLYANAHYSALVALPMDAVVGRKTMDFYFDPADRQRLLEALHRDGHLHNYEFLIKAADGTPVWVASSCQRTTLNGEPVIVSGFYDLSERKRMEEALQHSEKQLKDLINNIPAVVHLKSVEGRYLLVNAQFEQLYDTISAQLLGKTAYDILPQDVAGALQKIDTQVLQSRQMAQAEVSALRRDGLHTYLTCKFPLLDAAGEPYAICGISIDITERKRAEEALQCTAAELARSNAELEQFAYVASHDLQEPLRAVAGCMQLFQQRYAGQLDARADELIAHAVDGAARMRTLITDLLDYSRVTTHGTSFASVDCTTVLDQALANLQVALAESGTVVTHDPLPTVLADATQLLQLWQNLLSNAIKFRTEQPPVIHVGAERQADTWLLSVRDNGIGIEPQYAERIFGIFQRLHTRREYPGTGIGLAVCKKIVERHGGRMWVVSELGKGATFYFTLHARPEATPGSGRGHGRV